MKNNQQEMKFNEKLPTGEFNEKQSTGEFNEE